MPTISSSAPPHSSNKRKAENEHDQSSPSRKRSRSSSPNTPLPPKRRPIGPALPPADLSTMPTDSPNNDAESTSSDDDDDFGPSLPPAPGSITHHQEAQRLRQLQDAESASAAAAAKPQREEWMLLPPSADGLNSSRMDPTKLKNRKFQTGKGAKAPSSSAASGGVGDTWTETPEQKRQRLEDEVLGRKKPAQLQEVGDGEGTRTKKRREEDDREAERRIKDYNEKMRGGALMDEGRWTGKAGAGKREEEDDPSKRAFDREKDMKIGGAVGFTQKRELLNQAKNMGDRFAKGSYL